jgi:hypothetical protein
MVLLKFYLHCIRRTFREVLNSYGISSRVQWINTGLTIIPVIIFSIKIYLSGNNTKFIEKIQENFGEFLFGFVWFLIVLLFSLLRSPFLITKDLNNRINQLEENIKNLTLRLTPRLIFEFEDSSPFVQQRDSFILLRIRVRNMSEINTIKNISAQLVAVQPDIVKYLPITLHQMHDNPRLGINFMQSFDLSPSASKYIDVINTINENNKYRFYIEHAVRNVPKEPIDTITSLTICAYAENCPPLTQVFQLKNENNKPILVHT